jgi:hypothetical protein
MLFDKKMAKDRKKRSYSELRGIIVEGVFSNRAFTVLRISNRIIFLNEQRSK